MTKRERHSENVLMMGLFARVSKILIRKCLRNDDYTDARLVYDEKPIDPRVGWIVGFRTVYEGAFEDFGSGGGPLAEDPPEYQTEFVRSKAIRCLCVAFWPTMRPVLVRREDKSAWGLTTDEPHSPASISSGYMTPELRASLSADSRNWPRDARGRWIKEGPK